MILLAATVVSAALGDVIEAAVIGVILLFIGFMGFLQEYRAEGRADDSRSQQDHHQDAPVLVQEEEEGAGPLGLYDPVGPVGPPAPLDLLRAEAPRRVDPQCPYHFLYRHAVEGPLDLSHPLRRVKAI
jgi:hypothetical protein